MSDRWRLLLEDLAGQDKLTVEDEQVAVRRALIGGLAMAKTPDDIGLLIARHAEYVGAQAGENGDSWAEVLDAVESQPKREK